MIILIGEGDEKNLHSFNSLVRVYPIPSMVLPLSVTNGICFVVEHGEDGTPKLETINAIVHSAKYSGQSRNLRFEVSFFDGHKTAVSIVAPLEASKILLDGKRVPTVQARITDSNMTRMSVEFVGKAKKQRLDIVF